MVVLLVVEFPGLPRAARKSAPAPALLRALEARAQLSGYSGRSARQMRTALYVSLLFAAATSVYPISLATLGEWELAGVMVVGVLCYVSPLFLIPRGVVWLAKLLPGVALCVLVYVLGGVLGPASNIHLWLFLVLGWCASVFDLQSERWVVGLLLTLASATFVLIQEGLVLRIGSLTPNAVTTGLMSRTMPVSVLLSFAFILLPAFRRSQVDEDRLGQSHQLLEDEIVRRVVAEQGMREVSARLAEANQAKANFISMMGHELRTPLNGVLGVNQLLKETPLQDEQRELVQAIDESGQKLLSLVNDILDYVNVRSGGASLAKVPFNLLDLCEESVKSFEQAATKKGLELDLTITPTTPCLVLGDPSRIRQTLKELIGNALTHTEEGWIDVVVGLEERLASNQAIFSFVVADSGPGVPEEFREEIFEEFTQSRGGPSREHSGIGLGLAFCKRLLESMDGRLSLECPPEGGSRFTVMLPLGVPAQPVEKQPLEGMAFAVRGKSPRATRSLESVLTRLGASVDGTRADVIPINIDDGTTSPQDDSPANSETRRLRREVHLRSQVLGQLKPWLQELIPASSPWEATPIRALVVEDNPVNQKVLVKLLEKLGALVECVGNGALAVERCRSNHLDVVFMDIEMPVMNGLDATKAIRALPGREELPIVGVSANATPEEQQRGLDVGMNCYLPKPVRKEQIAEVLRRVHAHVPVTSHLASS